MLSFLVTSGVRRRLLQLLWGEDAHGTATELAEQSGVGFASAYRELQAMRSYHLVTTTVVDGREVYAANPDLDPEDTKVLEHLARSRPRVQLPQDTHAQQVRRELRALGAPLQVEPTPGVPDVERTLSEGVRLARRDATVARILPLCFAKARPRLDRDRLLLAAKRVCEKQAVGFFLALTAELTGDRDLGRWAASFRDHRVRQVQDFFELPPSAAARELAEKRTPRVARQWSYRMNMGLDSFMAPLEKFGHAKS